ncbi:putative insecticidal toxin complex protein B [Pseudomonas syringae pv. cilantro]|uniref:Putative insecticidal toxin complex protein B n=2 Tax=Pseudomonas syringae group TaxID=136849 RepID=A0A0N0X934_PSESX|nr:MULTISPECIES: SpvB/TcaC N-terminal domain-containing protein [Pseudomonas syringae group]KPC28002.1 putative insecticidal toxin complex protein B [Pseudomonas syringae pv. cilantro]RMN14824.1 putative insecticidal toxin complex protein B [Pseudomonas syringae pv. coriandricola]
MEAQSQSPNQSPQTLEPAVVTPSLPKGGGAIQSIGKGWGSVGTSGAASLEIALPISPGRGYAPALSLTYQSTAGNGLFGLGWGLNTRSVSRRASKGVPLYTDDDLFLGPGGDVCLPERDDGGALIATRVSSYDGHALNATYQVVRYFARVEGAFDRIEHWRIDFSDPGFWLIHGADGSLHIYGKKASSRSADPADTNRVAEWLLEESMNATGEHILYEYKPEDEACLPDDHPRDFSARRYLWRVRYGNALAHPVLVLWDKTSLNDLHWHFDLLFDYGERSTDPAVKPTYAEQTIWPVRSDPHSSFAYGFELGHLRLCRQVLMFHHFPDELGEEPLLVQRLLLEYLQTYLKYNLLIAAHSQAWDGTDWRQLDQQPPLQFQYTEFDSQNDIYTPLDALAGLNDGQRYQMVDLFGDGIPGVLYRDDKAWLYREPVRDPSGGADAVIYAPYQVLPRIPIADSARPVRQTLTDLTGDGRLDWVAAQPGVAGFFTLNPDQSWSGFATFSAFPLEFFHPSGQLADLVGDGLSDLAMIGPRSVRLYANRRAAGFAAPVDVPHDEDRLPLLSDSPNELVAFSDILGSGQQHLIRIRHNEIRFWPNLGRGRFGKGQLFAALPFSYETFDASRVRLADLDGSGASDFLYLQTDCFLIFMNECGNGLAPSIEQPWPKDVRYDRFCQFSAVDLPGLGFSSLVLTVPHMTPRHWSLYYAADRAGTVRKPYLLKSTNNNLGAAGEVTYRSSAQEWLDEKNELRAAGSVAVSELPFPVHVVVRQTMQDKVTGNTLTQLFRYRQGFYDPREREFRGFGLLLQTDTETPPQYQEGFNAPVLKKTWFHTGRYPARPCTDYDRSDLAARAPGEHVLSVYNAATQTELPISEPDEATLQEMARTLSGSVLRSEVFGLDASQRPTVLYSTQSCRYLVRQLQALSPHRPYTSMLPLNLEVITYRYEADELEDPMCEHSLNLAWDLYGSTVHSVSVNYARRKKPDDAPPFADAHQQQWWQASHDEAQQQFYLNEMRAEAIHLDSPQSWRLGLPYRARSNAMVVQESVLTPAQISYEQCADPSGFFATLPRTLIGLSVQRYIGCSEGEATFQALPDASETAELDDHALTAYERVMDSVTLAGKLVEIGYQQMPSFLPADRLNLWSVKRGFATYAGPEHFFHLTTFRPTRSHGWSLVEYDAYNLFTTRMTDPAGCVTTAEYDYRVLQPRRIIDPNQNSREADYDAFGRVWATSFYGTELGEEIGFPPLNRSGRYWASASEAALQPVYALGRQASALYYDGNTALGPVRIPLSSAALVADRYPEDPDKQIRISMASIDGFGRTLQTHQKVEDGDAYSVDQWGNLELVDGKPKVVHASPRWRVSERVEYNNKGLAVRVYRPYFANSHIYINDASIRALNIVDKQFYDPLGRPTVTITAKGWMRRQTYRTWYTISEDENDTAEEVLAATKSNEHGQ